MSVAVSVVMPVYNSEITLERAVQSVLSQTFQDLELIVVDDGSTDRSVEIVCELSRKDPRVKLIQSPANAGAAFARSLAEQASSSCWLAHLDADDCYTRGYLEALVTASRECGPGTLVVGEYMKQTANGAWASRTLESGFKPGEWYPGGEDAFRATLLPHPGGIDWRLHGKGLYWRVDFERLRVADPSVLMGQYNVDEFVGRLRLLVLSKVYICENLKEAYVEPYSTMSTTKRFSVRRSEYLNSATRLMDFFWANELSPISRRFIRDWQWRGFLKIVNLYESNKDSLSSADRDLYQARLAQFFEYWVSGSPLSGRWPSLSQFQLFL